MSALTVAIGEARPFVREGLVRVLSATPGIAIVGAAAAPKALLHLASRRPDVAIVGASLDRAATPVLVARFAARCPTARILVLHSDSGPGSDAAFLQAGAARCLAADATPADLLAALRLPGTMETAPGPSPPAASCLTAREREVAVLIASGHTNGAIAVDLGISLATVITHRTNLYRKLAVHNVGELVAAATQQGLIATPGAGAR
jgi:DNA-binding NarL/FixJ family response regulator